MTSIAMVEYTAYNKSIKIAFEQIGADSALAKEKKILIKPNLVNSSPYPITTPPECCEAVINYLKEIADAEIVIAEGCGDKDLETDDIFKILGYTEMAAKYNVPLIDLNYAPLTKLSIPDCPVFPEMYLPEIAFTHYIISVPVLKAHSLSDVTGSLKNMIGFAPPEHYSGQYGIWKKAVFHNNMHQSILDLNRYRTPDLTVMDASIGMAEYHLGGPQCEPPVNKILAGFNPVEVDRMAAGLLGLDWKTIPHLDS